MAAVPVLETAWLRLRAHRPDDFDAYAAMWAEPAVVRFIGSVPLSREAAWSRFLRHAGLWQMLGFGFFALEERATGRFVGQAGFQDLRRDLTPSIEGTMEAGWALAPEAQGRGLAEEAMRAALAWADAAQPGVPMSAIVAPEHAASLRIAGKLGFAEAARADYQGGEVVILRRLTPVQAAGSAARSWPSVKL